MQEENVLNLGEIAREQKRNSKKREVSESKSKTRAEHNRRVRVFKLKLYSILFVLVSVSVGVYWFADNYYLRNPVLLSFQSVYVKRESEKVLVPVVMGQETVSGSKVSTHEEKVAYIRGSKYPVILAGVWFRESTSGKNDNGHHKYCDQVGYSNEFGFNVYGENKECFTSFEESVKAVESWFDSKLKKLSVDQALCLYNQGGDGSANDCTYAHDYRRDESKVWTDLTK